MQRIERMRARQSTAIHNAVYGPLASMDHSAFISSALAMTNNAANQCLGTDDACYTRLSCGTRTARQHLTSLIGISGRIPLRVTGCESQ